MEKKDVYDMLMKSEQDIREGKQVDDRNYLDVALEGCKNLTTEFEGTFDGPLKNEVEENLTVEEIKLKYHLQDDDIALRFLTLKSIIRTEKQQSMSYDELLAFLHSAMNYGEMQIWLMKKEIEGVQLTLNDQLKKFFELQSNDDILRLYDVEQSYNQNNIDGLTKVLEKKQ